MTTITSYIYANLIGDTWTDISSDVLAYPVAFGNWGMASNKPTDRLAKRGQFKFSLRNTDGSYTPDGSSALTGWKKGTPIKVVFTSGATSFTRWYGKVDTIRIDAGTALQRRVHVIALDWLDYASKYPIQNTGVLADKRADEGITEIVSSMPVQPLATDYDIGTETFPTILDNVTSTTKAYSEFSKFAMSELGYVFLKKDPIYGETLRFEASDYRNGLRELAILPSDDDFFLLQENGDKLLQENGDKLLLEASDEEAVFIDSMVDAAVVYGDHQINRITVVAYPRRIDASLQVLFTLSYPLPIGSGQTITFRGSYTDPSGGAIVNADPDTMITPGIHTDYKMWTNDDGTGTDITSSLSIIASYGSEGVTYTLTNTSANSGFITKLQARGYGIYIYNPTETSKTSTESISEYGYQNETINQLYKQDTVIGRLEAEKIIEQEKNPRVVLNKVSFVANKSEFLTSAFLRLDIGDLVHIQEEQAEIDAWFFIQGIEFEIYPAPQNQNGVTVTFSWIVKEHRSLLSGDYTSIATEYEAGTGDAINFGYIPYITTAALTEMSISCWIYLEEAPTSTDFMIFTCHSDNGGWLFYLDSPSTPGDRELTFYTTLFTTVGRWVTINRFNTGGWVHLVLTFVFATTSDPVMYANGTSYAVTEETAPTGTLKTNVAAQLVIGNTKTAALDYSRPFYGQIKDCRIYGRILSAGEVTTLYNGGVPDDSLVTDGLIFQGPVVRTEDISQFIDSAIIDDKRVLDNIRGLVGTANDVVIGRAF